MSSVRKGKQAEHELLGAIEKSTRRTKMKPSNDEHKRQDRDDNGRTWAERNGPTIFGVSVFVSLFLVGALMRIAG